MAWTLTTIGGQYKESPLYMEFLIDSPSDLQNECHDYGIPYPGSIAEIPGGDRYMKTNDGDWVIVEDASNLRSQLTPVYASGKGRYLYGGEATSTLQPGNVYTASRYATCDFLSVIPGMTLHLEGFRADNQRAVCVYNQSKEFVKVLAVGQPVGYIIDEMLPDDAYYIRACTDYDNTTGEVTGVITGYLYGNSDFASLVIKHDSEINELKNKKVNYTDYASDNAAGIAKVDESLGISIDSSSHKLFIKKASEEQISNKTTTNCPITPDLGDSLVRACLTSNSKITDADKPLICDTIGAAHKNETIAVSNEEDIIVNKPTITTKVYGRFVEDNDLRNKTIVKNTVDLLTDKTIVYYSSISTALSDIGNNTYDNGHDEIMSDDVCLIAKNDEMIILQLIKNCSYSENITITKSFLLDLNGYVLDLNGMIYINSPSEEFVMYGMKPNSEISVSNTSYVTYLFRLKVFGVQIIGVTYNRINVANTTDLENQYSYMIFGQGVYYSVFDSIKSTIESSRVNAGVVLFGTIPTNDPFLYEILNCDVYYHQKTAGLSSTAFNFAGTSSTSNYEKGQVRISECKIKFVHDNDLESNSASSIKVPPKSIVIIQDSELSGTNTAIQPRTCTTIISNSLLTGCIHGGIYLISGGTAYIKDSILGKINQEGIGSNPHAAYIGYGANAYFDNVSFMKLNELGIPAVKQGDGSTTVVHMSNCMMSGLRVDSGCIAYLGLGILQTIKTGVYDGAVIDTYRKTYSYELTDANRIVQQATVLNKEWKLKGTITTETMYDGGALVDLSGCTELIIQGTATASGDRAASIVFTVDGSNYNAIPNVFDTTIIGKAIYYYGVHNGFSLTPMYCGRGQIISAAMNQIAAAHFHSSSLASLTRVATQAPFLSECNIEIYAK